MRKKYLVHGIKRRSSTISSPRIDHLRNTKNFYLHYGDLADFNSLFNLINECYMSGTRIYLSSTSVTKDLRIRLTDLASRLSSFTAIEIPEITEEEKIEALIQSSKRKGFVLDKKTVQYIVSYTSRNLSDLLKLLNELDSFSLQKKRKISPALVREMVSTK